MPRDVVSSDSVAELGAAVAGVGGADILIHDAGIYPMETLAERDVRVMPTVMAVNLDVPAQVLPRQPWDHPSSLAPRGRQ